MNTIPDETVEKAKEGYLDAVCDQLSLHAAIRASLVSVGFGDMLAALQRADCELTVRLRVGLTTDAEMSAQQASELVDTSPAIILIRAAIAKAEGRSP